jgi:nucleotide-binding universal stress UspA family protein
MIKILVPVDYSDHARTVLDFASNFATKVKAELVVLYVWETMPHFPPGLQVTLPSGPRPLEEVVQDNAAREMREFLAGVAVSSSVPVVSRIDSGPAARRILERIATDGIGLVIIGTHGRGGVKHWALGSVAERIVRLSPVPVITVPERRPAVVTAAHSISP